MEESLQKTDILKAVSVRKIEIKLYKPLEKDGSKELAGVLKSFDDKSITITDENGSDINIARTDMAVIKLALDI